jgi:DNA-binding Xre family transcriptional regulator
LSRIRDDISVKSAHAMDAAKTVQRKIREMQGELTHRAYAKKLGLTTGTLSRLKDSAQDAKLSTIEKISRALRVTPSQLLDDLDNHHRRR